MTSSDCNQPEELVEPRLTQLCYVTTGRHFAATQHRMAEHALKSRNFF
jgi:hypothetical protein